MDGLALGTFVDFLEGKLLDFMLGTDDLGDVVGRLELTFDGVLLGLRVGLTEGVVAFTTVFIIEGVTLGCVLGNVVFIIEGVTLGLLVGLIVGSALGFVLGRLVFIIEGNILGCVLGLKVVGTAEG